MITWWDEDSRGYAHSINVLFKPRMGFTNHLIHRPDWDRCFPTWIDGPYGTPAELGDYGTVVMLATDIGIAAQIPHMKELLRDLVNRRIRTRRIALYWQLKDGQLTINIAMATKLMDWQVTWNGCLTG